MNTFAVLASEGGANGVSAGGIVGDLSSNWLLIVGVIVIAIAVFSIFIVPRFLDNALGLVSIVGVLFIAGAAMIAAQFIDVSTLTQAQLEGVPENIQTVDITATGFTVSWETNKSVIGAVRYGTEPGSLDRVAVYANPTEKKKGHRIQVLNLEAGGRYYVRIISGGKEYPVGDPIEVRLVGK